MRLRRYSIRVMSHVTTDMAILAEDETANDRAFFPNVSTSIQPLPYDTSTQETREYFGDEILSQDLLLVSSGSCVCRICHTNTSKESLISPCRCKGTLAHVHLSCLERWLNQSCRNHCELCRYRFNAIETPRYRWSESLRIWISHPRNRRRVQSDLLFLTLLTVVTMGLVMVCVHGMRYFVIEGKKIGISRLWTKGAIFFFLAVIVLGYATTVYLLAKDQVSPWYRWWRSTVNVRLLMEQQNQPRQRRPIRSRNSNDEQTSTNTNSNNGIRINTVAETREPSTSIDPNVVSTTDRISESQRSTIRAFEPKA